MKRRMSPESYRLSPRQAVVAMAILAFVLSTLFPSHFHLHHAGGSGAHVAGHEHVVVAHGHDIGDLTHTEAGHELSGGGEIVPKSQSPVSWVMALITVLLLLPLLAREACGRPPTAHRRLTCFDRNNTPPLRAPPRGAFS